MAEEEGGVCEEQEAAKGVHRFTAAPHRCSSGVDCSIPVFVTERWLVEAVWRQLGALFHFSVTGDSAYLLAPQRLLLAAQDEDGDTSVQVLHVFILIRVLLFLTLLSPSAGCIWLCCTASRRR